MLEYLLGQYCNSDDSEIIDEGVDNVKRILRDNYVRPDEAQKILSLLRERGSYTVIDRITVVLNTKEDRYEATFSNLGIKNIPISADYVKDVFCQALFPKRGCGYFFGPNPPVLFPISVCMIGLK